MYNVTFMRVWRIAALVLALGLASCGGDTDRVESGSAPGDGSASAPTTVHPNAEGLQCLDGENISVVVFDGGQAAQPGPQARGAATPKAAVEAYRQEEWPRSPRESQRRDDGAAQDSVRFGLPDENGRIRAILTTQRMGSEWFVGGYRACAAFEVSSRRSQ